MSLWKVFVVGTLKSCEMERGQAAERFTAGISAFVFLGQYSLTLTELDRVYPYSVICSSLLFKIIGTVLFFV